MTQQRIYVTLGKWDMFGLNKIAERQGRKPGSIARRMIEKAIERYENKLWGELALRRSLESDQKTYTSEEIKKEFGFNV